MKRFSIIPLFVVAILAFGCGEDPITAEAAKAYVDQWAPSVEQTLTDRSEGASIQRELETVIEANASVDGSRVNRDEPPYDSLVRDVYKANEYKPRLVIHGELSKSGEAIWNALRHLEDHVLEPRDYPIAEISQSLKELEKLRADHEGGDLSPNAAEKAAMVEWLTARTPTEFPLTEENHDKLTDALVESGESQRLNELLEDYEALGEKLAAASASAEFQLASSLARYSDQMKHFRVRQIFIHPREDDYYNDPEIRKTRPDEAKGHYVAGQLWRRASSYAVDMHKAKKKTIRHRNIRETVAEILKAEEPSTVVTGLEPQQPQYRKLISEFKRYKKIVADGGWKKVDRKNLRKGSTHSVVKDLKERLRAEGYYPDSAPIDENYDEALVEAVSTYQETHQMPIKGTPYAMFWSSLNVSAADRLDQIRLNVQRWRDTNIRHEQDEVYVFINVPDFHAEAWENQERKLRHRIIVGNNDRLFDEEKEEWQHSNRTPVPLAAYIDRAIYNPFWNVTPRIRAEEILPEVKTWLVEKYKKEALTAKIKPLDLETPTGAAANEVTVDDQEPTLANTTASNPTSAPPSGDQPPAMLSPDPANSTGVKPKNPLEGKPYWNEETGEIDPSTTDPENIPGWYAENHYEVMYAGKKWEYVRMTPGDHNALGFVKIIFPNLHDVYLHDTNARALFGRDIRAMSHGCMRLQDPLDFAEWLLRRDELYEKSNIPKVLKTGEYLPVFLERQIPVFIEYYTVRVDDKGRANFLADIYDYDDNAHLPEPVVGKAAAP